MKIFVIHGDDSKSGYGRLKKYIDTAKKRSWEIAYIDSESNRSISEVISSNSLFSTERFFIVKDIKIFKNDDFAWINKKRDALRGNLIIYSNTVISQTFLKKFEKIEKVEEFKLPFLIYKFLDSFYPKNSKNCFMLFQELLEHEPVEFVFSFLARHIKDLYWVNLKNTPNYPTWRISKLKTQSSKFGHGELKKILNKFSLIDYKNKIGEANLKDELDLIIATSLE